MDKGLTINGISYNYRLQYHSDNWRTKQRIYNKHLNEEIMDTM